jgi:transketolase
VNLFFENKLHPLSEISRELRLDILNTVYHAGFGHIGGSLSSIDILTSLYFGKKFDFDRDHFILSAGHLCLAHYTILAKIGKFPQKLLTTYAEFGSILQGHESTDVPGIEYSAGSLGQGLSFACGLALGDKDHHTVCLTTDGEHNEGQIWEAVMFANKYHLGNLINIVDHNGVQIGGTTDDIMPLKSLAAKYIQNGWTVTTVNGHDLKALNRAIIKSKDSTIYPACIIAKTISGKGITYMERKPEFHDVKELPQNLYLAALDELKK